MRDKLQQFIKGQMGQIQVIMIAGLVAFFIGVVLVALSLTYAASSALLLIGIVVGGAGVGLMYLSARI